MLCDFGLSTVVSDPTTSSILSSELSTGIKAGGTYVITFWLYIVYSITYDILCSIRYMAPEIMNGEDKSAASDVYAFAMLMLEV